MEKNGRYAELFRMQAENYRETEDERAARESLAENAGKEEADENG